jgi:hypothetical protein
LSVIISVRQECLTSCKNAARCRVYSSARYNHPQEHCCKNAGRSEEFFHGLLSAAAARGTWIFEHHKAAVFKSVVASMGLGR